jgi:hypothetical protein
MSTAFKQRLRGFGRTPFPWCEVEFGITAGHAIVQEMEGRAVFTLHAGSATLQTYLSADECRQLASALAKAADVADEQKATPLPPIDVSDFGALDAASRTLS